MKYSVKEKRDFSIYQEDIKEIKEENSPKFFKKDLHKLACQVVVVLYGNEKFIIQELNGATKVVTADVKTAVEFLNDHEYKKMDRQELTIEF